MTSLHRFLSVAVTAAVVATAVVACGGDSSSPPPEAAPESVLPDDERGEPVDDPYAATPLSSSIPEDAAGRQLRWLLEAGSRLPLPHAEIVEHFAPSVLAMFPPDQVNASLTTGLDPAAAAFIGVLASTPTSIDAVFQPTGGGPRQVVSVAVDADGRIAELGPKLYPLRSRAERGLDPVALPEPTGPHGVGTTTIVVTDPARGDRRIPVALWFPAGEGGGGGPAPYAGPAVAAMLAEQLAVPVEDVAGIEVHARSGAPVARRGLPVVLFSPGYEVVRSAYAGFGAELASHGYLVAVLDHPGDGRLVEYPDGTTVPGQGTTDIEDLLPVRVADGRAVLDELGRLDGPLRGAADLDRVAFVGHSLGGASAAEAMHLDERFDVGANLDGSMFGPVVESGLARPFLLMGAAGAGDETWTAFASRSPGVTWMEIDGAAHMSFSDVVSVSALRPAEEMEGPDVFGVGTLDPDRSVEVQRAHLTAFLDQHLLGRPTDIFDGPSDAFPEVRLR